MKEMVTWVLMVCVAVTLYAAMGRAISGAVTDRVTSTITLAGK